MLSTNQRSAIAALDAVRPVVARLDVARHPDDVAADVIESWSAVETALRSLLGGSSLTGQSLVSEVRQRGLLDYAHAHALLGFLAARDRVSRTDYRPTDTDVDAARSGFQAVEAALGVGIGADTATYPSIRISGGGVGSPPPPPTPPTPPMRGPARAAASAAAHAHAPDVAPLPVSPRRRGPGLMMLLIGLVLLAVLGAWAWTRGGEPSSLRDGRVAYQRGDRANARRLFEQAAIDRPKLAVPHIYLARLARDDGDRARANAELQKAITLEPANALAMREMGQLQLQIGAYPLAVKFFDRALRIDATDRVAAGWMGCALQRQGQVELATRFFQRAGQGDWSSCQQAVAPTFPGALPPGAAPPPTVPPGAVPALPRP